jgi:hypothetical protein
MPGRDWWTPPFPATRRRIILSLVEPITLPIPTELKNIPPRIPIDEIEAWCGL